MDRNQDRKKEEKELLTTLFFTLSSFSGIPKKKKNHTNGTEMTFGFLSLLGRSGFGVGPLPDVCVCMM